MRYQNILIPHLEAFNELVLHRLPPVHPQSPTSHWVINTLTSNEKPIKNRPPCRKAPYTIETTSGSTVFSLNTMHLEIIL